MENVIRILHVVHGMDCGGAENMIMNIYRKIDRSKIQFDFMVHTEKKCFFDDEITSLGGIIYRVPYYYVRNGKEYKRSVQEIFEKNCSIKAVHGHLGSCAHIYLKIANKYGCFTIAHSHNTNPTDISIKNTLYYLFNIKTRRIAKYFIGCSLKAGQDRFGKRITQGNNFTVLNNAIDTEKFIFDSDIRDKVRNSLGITNEYVLGHVGRFNYQKNHTYLIDIFFAFLNEHPNSVLVLVGEGSLRKEIQDKVNRLNIGNKVIFTGLRNDVNELLQGFDCFVFPSHYEGLPVTVIEAQASGLKCVLSDNITKEVAITDLISFVPINSNDIEKWRLKMDSNYVRKDMHKEITEAGYDINTTVKWIENLYMRQNGSK